MIAWFEVDTVLLDMGGTLIAERTSLAVHAMHKQVFIAFLAGCAPFAMADIGELVVDLPPQVEWTMVTDEATDGTYNRAWIPAGTTVEDTELWMIVSQKFDVEKRMSARLVLRGMRDVAGTNCTDMIYSRPKKVVLEYHLLDRQHLYGVPKRLVEKYTTYSAGHICARRHDREYGTVTQHRVLARRNTVFVVTSELRVPPTSEAGSLPFDTRDDYVAFLKRMDMSSRVVHDAVRVVRAP